MTTVTIDADDGDCEDCGIWIRDFTVLSCEDCLLPVCENCGTLEESTGEFLCKGCFLEHPKGIDDT